jgi:hypothetical protein
MALRERLRVLLGVGRSWVGVLPDEVLRVLAGKRKGR